jgi:CRISPR-associated protein Csd1
MLLTKLSRYAKRQLLMDTVDLTPRKVAFTINIDGEGNVDPDVPVSPLTSADGKQKFQTLPCPAFPGEKNGGKADFLFETPSRVLGTDSDEIPRKTHENFWLLIREAKDATGDPRLDAVLKARGNIGAIAGNFKPAETGLVTFAVNGEPVFDLDSPVRQWHRERYLSIAMSEDETELKEQALCLVTGETATTAAGHPVIKGVPGTLAKGGRLISYEQSDVTLNSFGRCGNNASPIGQATAAEIGAALNNLIGNERLRLILGDNKTGAVFISWLDESEEAAASIKSIIERPMDDEAVTLINEFREGRFRDVALSGVYHGCVLAGNVSRISVLRELDKPVIRIIENLATWREDVSVEPFPSKNPVHEELSLRFLADVVTTARKSGDKPDPQMLANNMQELLFAMLDGTCPRNILYSLIEQVQKRHIKEGSNWLYKPASHWAFALIRMILNRIEGTPMSVGLDVTNTDTAYVSGRLFAVLCRIQRAAQGDLNRDFASSSLRAVLDNPQEFLPRVWEQAEYYLSKVQGGLANLLSGELHAVTDLLGAAGFPAEFTDEQQGKFLLGFRHQSAEHARVAQERKAAKREREEADE